MNSLTTCPGTSGYNYVFKNVIKQGGKATFLKLGVLGLRYFDVAVKNQLLTFINKC